MMQSAEALRPTRQASQHRTGTHWGHGLLLFRAGHRRGGHDHAGGRGSSAW